MQTEGKVAAGSVIRVRGLVKRYGDVRAVDGIDFDVAAGEVFGLVG
jgi:ABC-type multidrug transport system ATPase subunit